MAGKRGMARNVRVPRRPGKGTGAAAPVPEDASAAMPPGVRAE
ncbi:hypothetical protein BH24GEM1_BH24GEM1_05930 [soil metagenome]